MINEPIPVKIIKISDQSIIDTRPSIAKAARDFTFNVKYAIQKNGTFSKKLECNVRVQELTLTERKQYGYK